MMQAVKHVQMCSIRILVSFQSASSLPLGPSISPPQIHSHHVLVMPLHVHLYMRSNVKKEMAAVVDIIPSQVKRSCSTITTNYSGASCSKGEQRYALDKSLFSR